MKKKTILNVSSIMLASLVFSLSSCSSSSNAQIERWEVPSKYREVRNDEAGEVVLCSYTTKDYVDKSDKTEEKKVNVYLPYNYDENKQYNILYLIHGTDKQSTNHIETWLYSIGIKNVLDNMIHYGDIEPLIVVAPTFYSYGLYGDDTMTSVNDITPTKAKSTENFSYEFRYDLLPMIESKFSTYAASVEEKDLVASRDHRAMAGLSNGCRITYRAGMEMSLDYLSYFGCFSSSVPSEELLESLHSDKNKNYKINYMYNGDGIYDFAYNSHKKMYDELLKDPLFTGDNSEYVEIAFGYHSARSWRVGLYNALQRFFK